MSCSKAIYAVLKEWFKERNVYKAYHTEKLRFLKHLKVHSTEQNVNKPY